MRRASSEWPRTVWGGDSARVSDSLGVSGSWVLVALLFLNVLHALHNAIFLFSPRSRTSYRKSAPVDHNRPWPSLSWSLDGLWAWA